MTQLKNSENGEGDAPKKCGGTAREKRDFRSKIPSPLGRKSMIAEQSYDLSKSRSQGQSIASKQPKHNVMTAAKSSSNTPSTTSSSVIRNRPKSISSKLRRDRIFAKSVIVEDSPSDLTSAFPLAKAMSEQDFSIEKSDRDKEEVEVEEEEEVSLSLEVEVDRQEEEHEPESMSIHSICTGGEGEGGSKKGGESLIFDSQCSSIESSPLIISSSNDINDINSLPSFQTRNNKIMSTKMCQSQPSPLQNFSSKIPKRISCITNNSNTNNNTNSNNANTTKNSNNNNPLLNNNNILSLTSSKYSSHSSSMETSINTPTNQTTHSTLISTNPNTNSNSPGKTRTRKSIKDKSTTSSTSVPAASGRVINKEKAPVKSEKSNTPTTTRVNEFVRPRLITIIRNGMRPRKAFRFLLNQKTARSFDQVLNDITTTLKPDKGAIRKIYVLDGREISNLEGFFGQQDIFLASAKDRVGNEDFELDAEECKAIQPFVKIPLEPSPMQVKRVKGHVGSEKQGAPRFRPRSSPRFTGITTSSYIVNPESFTEVNHYPEDITQTYLVGDVIGDGAFAIVRICQDKASGDKFAMKVIDKSKCNQDSPPMHEVNILSRLNHPNIVHLFQQFDFDNELYVIMELVTGGDLFNAIAKATKFSEVESSHMTRDVASALSYLHARNIVHRDIKPENLLVSYDHIRRKRTLKLGDFGLAQIVNGSCLYTICGTPTYVAPEILAETGYGLKIDIWALGVIVYVLLCGYPPFASPTGEQDDLFDLILTGEFDFHPDQWQSISNDAKDLIYRMIESDIDLRLSADEVLEHPYLAVNQKDYEKKARNFYRRDFKFSVFETMGVNVNAPLTSKNILASSS